MLIPIILFSVGLVCLIKGGDWFVDGAVGIAGKSFGMAAAVKHLMKLLEEHPIDDDFPSYFLYSDDKGREELLLPKLKERSALPRRLHYCSVGPTIGTHIGPGAVGMAYIETP